MEMIEGLLPYVFKDIWVERYSCMCGNPKCPAAKTAANLYFFSRFEYGDTKVIWWHGRN